VNDPSVARRGRWRAALFGVCMAATASLLAVTRNWLFAGFFAFLLLLLVAREVLADTSRPALPSRNEAAQTWLNVVTWILILAAATVQVWVPAMAVLPVLLWWLRFLLGGLYFAVSGGPRTQRGDTARR
jgi:hypothetical protein